jgi:hypothetical protein
LFADMPLDNRTVNTPAALAAVSGFFIITGETT